MSDSSRWTSMAGLVVGVVFVASACSAAVATPLAATGGAGAPAAASLTLASTNSPTLGAYLTGLNGMTLYVLTKDTAGTSSCTGACATNWPPLTVASGAAITGPSGATAAFGTSARTDGTTQVTYNHWPLYYFGGDSKAGDTMGQGKLNTWFVAPLSGSLASAAPAMSPAAVPSAAPSLSSGY